MTRPRKPATHHGYVVIDKPAGWTSHDVVARVRRIVNEKRVGHAGTLDPVAVGVLPVAIGNATRTIEYLAEADKTYIADITLGITTDTADIEGKVTSIADAEHVQLPDIERVLDRFRGPQFQVPPMHSALKVDGQPLYERARRGEVLDIPARPIVILSLLLLDWTSPVARVEVRCSKGTYIRSLARDIGEMLGTGAHLSRLVRTQVGGFRIDDAMSLESLASSIERGNWDRISVHPDVAMLDHDALVLDESAREDWLFGRDVPADGATGTVRVYDANGTWLGVGHVAEDSKTVRPVKVVIEQNQDSA
jgi:tRNA pseudouridine55 synthase